MNHGYFAFKQQSYKKANKSGFIYFEIRSNEAYSNTGIIDLPIMWSPYYKITKRLMFGFRV